MASCTCTPLFHRAAGSTNSCRSCASIRPRCPGACSAACCRTSARTAASTRRTFPAAASRTRPRRSRRSPITLPPSATCSTRCDCARLTCSATRTGRWPPSNSRSRGPNRSVAYCSPARRYSMRGNARLSMPSHGRRARATMVRIWWRNGSASVARAARMPRSRASVRISPQRCARATQRPGARRPRPTMRRASDCRSSGSRSCCFGPATSSGT